jgi:hypothetical protein
MAFQKHTNLSIDVLPGPFSATLGKGSWLKLGKKYVAYIGKFEKFKSVTKKNIHCFFKFIHTCIKLCMII